MGDVVLINTGDGVFTGREPHTSHESNETLPRNRYLSDTEREILVKPSVSHI